jgi:hypothetical protein
VCSGVPGAGLLAAHDAHLAVQSWPRQVHSNETPHIRIVIRIVACWLVSRSAARV